MRATAAAEHPDDGIVEVWLPDGRLTLVCPFPQCTYSVQHRQRQAAHDVMDVHLHLWHRWRYGLPAEALTPIRRPRR